MPGTVIEIRDMEKGDTVLPPGKENVGEVCIIGPQVMKGYWKKPEETEKVLFRHPASNWMGLRTGDMGYMDADGWLYLVDRSKDLIISSGYNVYPRMIEEAVYEHPAVDECIVIGIHHPHRQEAPKVFVKLKPGASLTFEELLKHLDGKIGKHEMPIALEIRPELPKTPVGKLSKKELKEEERAKAQAKARLIMRHSHSPRTSRGGRRGKASVVHLSVRIMSSARFAAFPLPSPPPYDGGGR